MQGIFDVKCVELRFWLHIYHNDCRAGSDDATAVIVLGGLFEYPGAAKWHMHRMPNHKTKGYQFTIALLRTLQN